MNLKEKIVELLKRKNYTYKALADHLGVSETDLDLALETKALEVRVLEVISKELRIPLYSFFREQFNADDILQESYYNVKLWSGDEQLKLLIETLQAELTSIRKQMAEKDLLIAELQRKLKL